MFIFFITDSADGWISRMSKLHAGRCLNNNGQDKKVQGEKK